MQKFFGVFCVLFVLFITGCLPEPLFLLKTDKVVLKYNLFEPSDGANTYGHLLRVKERSRPTKRRLYLLSIEERQQELLRGVALGEEQGVMFLKVTPEAIQALSLNMKDSVLLGEDVYWEASDSDYVLKDKKQALELAKKLLSLADRMLPAGFEKTLKEAFEKGELQNVLKLHFEKFSEELPEFLHLNHMEWGFEVILGSSTLPSLPEEEQEEE